VTICSIPYARLVSWTWRSGDLVIIHGPPDRRLAFEWQLRYIASLYKMAVRSQGTTGLAGRHQYETSMTLGVC
jgi:hypothetical protein